MYSITNTLSVQKCRDNPNTVFVFGDNLIGRGKRGQAVIRDEPNAFGIPTKRLPSMREGSFFSEQQDEYIAVDAAIDKLIDMRKNGYQIVFPSSGVGTGLAEMSKRSPKLWSHMMIRINKEI